MSCNNWENGTFKFSTAEYGKFRKALIEAYNAQLAKEFDLISKVLDELKAAGKGKRNFNWAPALHNILSQTVTSGYGMYATQASKYKFEVIDRFYIERALILEKKEAEINGRTMASYVPCKPKSPKKADFPPVSVRNANSISCGEYGVSFNAEKREVSWEVSENNHAVDRARESFLGTTFFSLLGKVVWTRGTGGFIKGNDEYNEESGEDHCGGGGSYMKESYGPIGDTEFERMNGYKKSTIKAPSRPALSRW